MNSRSATIVAVSTYPISPVVLPDLVVKGARGTHDRSDFLLVRILTSAGVEGFGEVSATLTWSGEDSVTAGRVIDTALARAIIGQPIAGPAVLSRRMDAALAGNPFAKAGVSTAIWDAWARTLDVPLAHALGGIHRTSVPVKCSLSGDGPRLDETFHAATAAGFGAFKVKVGMDVDTDTARLRRARRLAGPDALIGLDANGGYSPDEAARALAAFRPSRPAFFEQPVRPENLDGMRAMRGLGLPVIADESVFGIDDLRRLILARAADVASVYVGKSSYLERAMSMAHTAAAFDVRVVLGSNGELGLGAAAQTHLACAAPSLDDAIPSDIIGALYYEEDVLETPLPMNGATVSLPDAPGLGVDLRPDLLERLRRADRALT
ncbi:enolase C-terminal domain-like protein [Kribbella sp. NPDC003505]|uniref:mandelate racemase/muconate lactonizing enzyme family protein n=1 Tax=Kribbella sp. NPDC003505 TaxID=3154448 RepID=UPI0033B09934